MKLKDVIIIALLISIGFVITNIENFSYSSNRGLAYSPKPDCNSPKSIDDVVYCSDSYCISELVSKGIKNTGYISYKKSYGSTLDPNRVEVFLRSSVEYPEMLCVLNYDEVVSIKELARKI